MVFHHHLTDAVLTSTVRGVHDPFTNEDKKQLASGIQDRFLIANLESFVYFNISQIVFPEQGVNM